MRQLNQTTKNWAVIYNFLASSKTYGQKPYILFLPICKRTLDLKRHPIWNKVYDHSKIISSTAPSLTPPSPPTPTPPPPPPFLPHFLFLLHNNFLLSGNRLSFYCYSRNLNLFCNFRNQVVSSKALIFHFSQESFLLSCFFIHIWRISHL